MKIVIIIIVGAFTYPSFGEAPAFPFTGKQVKQNKAPPATKEPTAIPDQGSDPSALLDNISIGESAPSKITPPAPLANSLAPPTLRDLGNSPLFFPPPKSEGQNDQQEAMVSVLANKPETPLQLPTKPRTQQNEVQTGQGPKNPDSVTIQPELDSNSTPPPPPLLLGPKMAGPTISFPGIGLGLPPREPIEPPGGILPPAPKAVATSNVPSEEVKTASHSGDEAKSNEEYGEEITEVRVRGPEVAIILDRSIFRPEKIRIESGKKIRLLFTTIGRRSAALIIERLGVQRWIAKEGERKHAQKWEINREISNEKVTAITINPEPGSYKFHDALSGATGLIIVE